MSDASSSSAPPSRPLSPHLQIYKPQITSAMSILHRITGVGLSLGAIALVVWLCAAAESKEDYIAMQGFFGSTIGIVLLLGWSWALFYHLCSGLRHLMWDMGAGLDLPAVYKTGYLAIAASIVLTFVSWVVGFTMFM